MNDWYNKRSITQQSFIYAVSRLLSSKVVKHHQLQHIGSFARRIFSAAMVGLSGDEHKLTACDAKKYVAIWTDVWVPTHACCVWCGWRVLVLGLQKLNRLINVQILKNRMRVTYEQLVLRV